MSVKFTTAKVAPPAPVTSLIPLAPSLSAFNEVLLSTKRMGLPQTQPTRTEYNHLNINSLKERQTTLCIYDYNMISSTHCPVSHTATVLAVRLLTRSVPFLRPSGCCGR